jgi:uncharacterized protein with HEPN domain
MREPIRDKERLEHIVEAIDNIFSFAKGKTVEDLDNEKILFYAVVKNIEIIGEAAFRLTKEFRQQHSETPWSSIVVMRHVLVHDYYQIKSKEVYKVINEDLQPLHDQIVRYLSNTDWETWEKQEIAPTESAVHQNMVQSARRMLSKGYSAKEISEITGLSLEEISML